VTTASIASSAGTAAAVHPTALLGFDHPIELPAHGPVPRGVAEDGVRHLARYGPIPALPRGRLTELVHRSGLTGHGGAHFPVARKWRAIQQAVTDSATTAGPTARRPVVVGNGAESEPASAKDAVLIQTRPHLVLDGLALCARELGADTTVLWLHEGDDASLAALHRARVERQAAGLAEPWPEIAVGPARYLSGESSAVLAGLSGAATLPTFRTVPAARSGFAGRPTAVHNVETLARVALAARTGLLRRAGGALLTVTGTTRTVLETTAGETFAGALTRAGRGTAPVAVLLGGYGGQWVAWPRLAELPCDAPALARHGLSMGAGVVVPLGPEHCGLATTAALLGYLAGQGAGQCGPCVFGLPALASRTTDLLGGGRRSQAADADLAALAGEIRGRGACGHPDGAVSLVASALSVFAADVAAHRANGSCLHSGRPAELPGVER